MLHIDPLHVALDAVSRGNLAYAGEAFSSYWGLFMHTSVPGFLLVVDEPARVVTALVTPVELDPARLARLNRDCDRFLVQMRKGHEGRRLRAWLLLPAVKAREIATGLHDAHEKAPPRNHLNA